LEDLDAVIFCCVDVTAGCFVTLIPGFSSHKIVFFVDISLRNWNLTNCAVDSKYSIHSNTSVVAGVWALSCGHFTQLESWT